MSKETMVGKISVDSGLVLICDPGYVNQANVKHGIDVIMTGHRCIRGVQPVVGKHARLHLGAVIKTFGGDGLYPVLVTQDESGRVLKVEVRFAEEERSGKKDTS